MTEKGKKDRERVWLSIKGCFGSEDVTGSPAEFMTEGDYYVESGTPCISYEEYALSGMGNTTTTIRLEDNRVSVIRMGDVTSLMEFVPGKHNTAMYCTPYGDVAIDTYTKAVDVSYDGAKNPRAVRVKYDLAYGSSRDANTIDIKIRPF